MNDKQNRTFFVFVCLAFLGLVVAVVFLWPDEPSPIDALESSRSAEDGSVSGSAIVESDNVDAFSEERPADAAAETTEREVIAPSGLYISGRVLDKETREPVESFEIALSPAAERMGNYAIGGSPIKAESFSNDEGRFRIGIEKEGRYDLTASSAQYLISYLNDVEVTAGGGLHDVEFLLDPGASVTGVVIDDVTGRPISGVVLGSAAGAGPMLMRRLDEGQVHLPHTITDDAGRFRLRGLLTMEQKIAALHPEYAEAWLRVTPGDGTEPVALRLKKGFSIYGKALDDQGEPCPGVEITMTSPEIPLHRFATTDDGGNYRMAPALSGWLTLKARLIGNEQNSMRHFYPETIVAELVDRDLEVNFGPKPEHVTWRGTLFDLDGKQALRGRVMLHIVELEESGSMRAGSRETGSVDDEGRFEFQKLALGRYRVDVWFGDRSKMTWKTIDFDEPGLVELDIAFGGEQSSATGAIRGQLVDRHTGAPLSPESVSVYAYSHSLEGSYSSRVDAMGRFHIRGLPAAIYYLSLHGRDAPPKFIHNITVKKGETTDGVRFELEPWGNLRVELTGFDGPDMVEFKLDMERDGGPGYTCGTITIENGAWTTTRVLEIGAWTVQCTFTDGVCVKRRCEVFAGQTSTIEIERGELAAPTTETITVRGTVKRPSGEPVAEARIHFYGHDVPAADENLKFFYVVTESDGSFEKRGFQPGRWTVNGRLAGGGEPSFPDLVIPPGASDPYPCHLVLPDGTISARLVDRATGEPFGRDGPTWWVYLRDARTDDDAGELNGGHYGPHFQLVGIRAGEYFVVVRADGYVEYKSDPFRLDEGRKLDLGTIAMDTGGVLFLEVLDQTGSRIEGVRVYCNRSYQGRSSTLDDGRYRYIGLPLGEVVIDVTAPGHQTAQRRVSLARGFPCELQIVMQPK